MSPRRIGVRRRVEAGLTEADAAYLLAPAFPAVGRDTFGTGEGCEARLRAAWDAHGGALVDAVARWRPWERPWGWWQFDAPGEARHLVGALRCGRPVPLSAVPSVVSARPLRSGIPATYWGEAWPADLVPLWETSRAFLERTGRPTATDAAANAVHAADAIVREVAALGGWPWPLLPLASLGFDGALMTLRDAARMDLAAFDHAHAALFGARLLSDDDLEALRPVPSPVPAEGPSHPRDGGEYDAAAAASALGAFPVDAASGRVRAHGTDALPATLPMDASSTQ